MNIMRCIATHTETNERYAVMEQIGRVRYIVPYHKKTEIDPSHTHETTRPNALYKHYKGGYYKTYYSVLHRITGERFVLYEDNQKRLWLRPYAMFHQHIERNGQIVPRFRRISPIQPL